MKHLKGSVGGPTTRTAPRRFRACLALTGSLILLVLLFLCPPMALGQGKDGKSSAQPGSGSAAKPSVAADLAEVKKLLEAQAHLLQEQAKLIEELRARVSEQERAIAGLQQELDVADGTADFAARQSEQASQAAGQAQQTSDQVRVSVTALQKQTAELEKNKAPATKLPEWLGRTAFSGTAYLRYSRELPHNAKDFNQFELDRVYFILRSQLTDRVSLRYTMEGARRDSAGDFDVATKHFFFEVAKFPFTSSRFVAGLADLPWVPYEEGIWGYRFQGTVFPDREGYLTSTDLGLGWKVELPQKLGDFHLALVNGEGWTKPEAGKYKDVHLRFTFSPFRSGEAQNIFFGAFGSTGKYDALAPSEPRNRQRAILQGGYRGKHVRFMGSFLWARDPAAQLLTRHPSLAARAGELAHGRGLSFFTVINFGLFSERAEKWEWISRYDRLDPDRDIQDNEHQRWIFGTSYRWNRYVQTLFDYEHVFLDAGSQRPRERRLMLQNEIRF